MSWETISGSFWIIKISLAWIMRSWQYKHNYIDTYLHPYVLTFTEPHKNKLKEWLLRQNQKGWNNRNSLWKNCPSRILLKRLWKCFLKSNDILFKFHLRMVVTKLKPNLCTTYIELCKNFERRDRETDRNGNFH